MLWQYHQIYAGNKTIQFRLLVSTLSVFLSLAGMTLLFLTRNKESLHGQADFASEADLRKADLFNNDGVIIGKFNNQFLVIKAVLHVLLAAATRSGKGVAIVIPNLLFWRQSVVNTDMKLENYKITSKARKVFFKNEIYLFDPFNRDGITNCYNPLDYIDRENKRKLVDDIQVIANLFFPDVGEKDPIWISTPKTLFMGIVMLLIETPGKAVTIGQVLRESMVSGDGTDYLKAVVQQRKNSDTPLSMHCENFLTTYTGIDADATRAGIIAGFRARLDLWTNPLIDAATSKSDFDFRDLRRKRITIYNALNPRDVARAGILSSLFWQQLISVNLVELPEHNPALKFKVLLLLDEFAVLGRLDVLLNGVAFLAGYGFRLLTIFQSPGQLIPVYKSKEAVANFLDNHHAHIIYTPPKNDNEISNTISNALGFKDLIHDTFSRPKSFWKDAGSINTSDQKRALMLPQELREMPQDREIVLYRETNPIRASKAYYYNNRYFVDLLCRASQLLSDQKKSKLIFRGFSELDIKRAVKKRQLEIKSPQVDYESFDKSVELSMSMAFEVIELEKRQKEEAEQAENGDKKLISKGKDDENSGNSNKFPENETIEREITHEDLQNIYNMPVELFCFDPLDLSFAKGDPIDEFALLDIADQARARFN